jgi:hypothetical protein
MIKKITCTLAICLFASDSFSQKQTLISPNYSLKSHETLEIKKIESGSKAIIFYMRLENRIAGGEFCGDKNIFLLYPDGKRSKLGSSTGIPVCPETYKFKAIGEKLDFVLEFPPLKSGTEWVDLVEDCSDNCFSFYGISLNSSINRRIDDAFALAENGEEAKALTSFISIVDGIDKSSTGIKGLLYINIIKLAKETGDELKAEEWYKKFKLSDAPRLSQHLNYLNEQGVKY